MFGKRKKRITPEALTPTSPYDDEDIVRGDNTPSAAPALEPTEMLIQEPQSFDDVGKTEPLSLDDLNGSVGDEMYNEPSFVVSHAQIVGKRERQEDSLCYSDWNNAQTLRQYGLLAAVADGIGGVKDGAFASNSVVNTLHRQFKNQNRSEPGSDRLLTLAANAQMELSRANRRENAQAGTKGVQYGTTLVSVLIYGWHMWLLSVGDSRVYLYRAGGLLQLNREHVFDNYNAEDSALGRAAREQSMKRRVALVSYMGGEDLRFIDRTVQPLRLMRGDRILLMSDGVFKTLSDEELLLCMRNPAANLAASVIQTLEQRNAPGQDNATIITIEVA